MTTLLEILPVRAWVFVICSCSCLALGEEKMLPTAAGDRHLVEVTFALDDRPPTEDNHTVVTFWISETSRGMTRWVYNWSHGGAHRPDTNALENAAKCLKLIKALAQPKDLPELPNQIVAVRGSDGDNILVRKFSIARVPSQVHEILTIMGCREAQFARLKFTKEAAEPDGAANRSQPIRSETNRPSAAAGSGR